MVAVVVVAPAMVDFGLAPVVIAITLVRLLVNDDGFVMVEFVVLVLVGDTEVVNVVVTAGGLVDVVVVVVTVVVVSLFAHTKHRTARHGV